MSDAQPVILLVVFSAVFVAAITDAWKFRVYNALTLPLLLGGMAYHGIVGGGLSQSLLGAAFGVVPLLILHAAGGMGAGDVKLAGGMGAWLGPAATVNVLLNASLAAGCCSLGILVVTKSLYEIPVAAQARLFRFAAASPRGLHGERVETVVAQVDRRRRVLPFAVMLAVGVCASFLGIRWI